MTEPRTEIASHRGGAAHWPENSETAFRETAKLAVEQIEFDVQMSADAVPVIFHDTTLDRMTDGSGPLAERTLAELKALSITAGGGRILTLDEGLDLLAPTHLILRCEIKPGPGMRPYPALREATLARLSERGLLCRTVLTSFHLPTLRAARTQAEADALRDLIWLIADPIIRLTSPWDVARLAEEAGIDHVAPHIATLRDGALAPLRAAGLRVGAFAVLGDDSIAWALGQELTVFTTDRPIAALELRDGGACSSKR
ncbi:glycerophosphodiester phosphodiesterase family protein [Rhodovulum sp. 12E13]|uniref:glycerophosphodiester phosphodiesterase n=1 Tax=Rhodovulum sp. 12E13 TaxID=2203891 RepID=UPI0013145D40|nr:glycerophosphodiester phosphodiesterase family protein [Rhodovulum sp. 12E13]